MTEEEKGAWVVDIRALGREVVVRPVHRLLGTDPGMGTLLRESCTYCRTARQIEAAKRRWQAWCDRRNADEALARRLAAEHGGEA